MVRPSQRLFCRTEMFLCYPRCPEEALIKRTGSMWSRVPHVCRDVSHLHCCSRQTIFWSYLLWISKEEAQMCAATSMPAFVQEWLLVSPRGKSFLIWWSKGAEDFTFCCCCSCLPIDLSHLRHNSVCNTWEFTLRPKKSGISGRVESLLFLSLCCQNHTWPISSVSAFPSVFTQVGQEGTSLDYAVSLSLNLKFWWRQVFNSLINSIWNWTGRVLMYLAPQ